MAEVLGAVRVSYYKRKNRKPGKRAVEEEVLVSEIKEVNREIKGIYRSVKIMKELRKHGLKVSCRRVRRLMREHNIKTKVKIRFIKTTDSRHGELWSPNLLNRNFRTSRPNEAWVSDISYIKVGVGHWYLCVIIDLFSRKVVGWSFRDHMRDDLVIEALENAVRTRRPPEGLIFHSDGGRQFVSGDFREKLKKYKMVQSMSRKGDPWDNAVAESFFSHLKDEEVPDSGYADSETAADALFSYIETLYNRKRMHYYLDDLSPEEFEKLYELNVVA